MPDVLFPRVRRKKKVEFSEVRGSKRPPPTHRQALDNRLCRTRLVSKCGDFAPFVAPLCIKGL
jgi:hypothetical protein